MTAPDIPLEGNVTTEEERLAELRSFVCPRRHRFFTHPTPCYGVDGEIYLPPNTVHCQSCFKVKWARRAK